jgi:hypothetical protein
VDRSGPAWLLGLPLAAIGWLAAHAVSYDLVAGDGRTRAHVLAASGHGYLEHAPLLAGGCVVLAAGGFLLRARGQARRSVSTWTLGALPVAGFAAQEFAERALHNGDLPWGVAFEPVFLVGLALQLPFALVAARVGRALTGFADAVEAQKVPRPRLSPCTDLPLVRAAERRTTGVLAAGHAGRAPPFAV